MMNEKPCPRCGGRAIQAEWASMSPDLRGCHTCGAVWVLSEWGESLSPEVALAELARLRAEVGRLEDEIGQVNLLATAALFEPPAGDRAALKAIADRLTALLVPGVSASPQASDPGEHPARTYRATRPTLVQWTEVLDLLWGLCDLGGDIPFGETWRRLRHMGLVAGEPDGAASEALMRRLDAGDASAPPAP